MTKTTPLIDIRPDHWDIVQGILQKHVPQYEVWAFGSRAKWSAKQYSDLDLAIITDKPLSLDISASLSDDFSESDLPYKVDIVDWATTSESFRKIIERDKVVVQKEKPCMDELIRELSFSKLLSAIVDNRGRTCPTASSGIPLIATNCVRNDFLYPTYDKIRFVSKGTYNSWFRGHPKPGDILFVNKATPGRVCIAPDPVDFCIAQDMVAIRANPNIIYPRYLFAALRSPIVQERIAQLHVGSLIPHFKKGDFDRLLVPVPDRYHQKFIGDTYFILSAKIELNRKQNETLEAMARALFKAWFVDFEPVRAKMEGRWQRGQSLPGLPAHLYDLFPDRLVDSELGEIPEGWDITSLSDYSSLNPESWTKRTRPGEIFYVDLSNTKWGRIENIASYEANTAPSRAQRVLRPFDTLVGTVRPGNGSFTFISDDGMTGSTGFAVLRPLQREYSEFVYLAATACENIKNLSNLADGGAYPAVSPEIISATQVPRANYNLLYEFSRQVSPMLAGMAGNERTSKHLAQLRDTLLPKLISGELRVPEVESFIKERGL